MYDLEIKEEVDKLFSKLAKKDKKQLFIIHKKIEEIRANPTHSYKFLKEPLQGFNRTHIEGSFVLIFKIIHEERKIIIYHYDHHDNVYKWKPKNE